MSRQSGKQTSLPLISSVEASLVKTFPRPASELALEVLTAAYGLNSAESFRSFSQRGLWLRMSPAERLRGLTQSLGAWQSSGMKSYRSRLRQRMLALRIGGSASFSLLPTLTRKANLLAPSMQKWRAHRQLLPTLSASSYGTNHGGAAGRVGPIRPPLRTLAGGPLCPQWCEWLMGFPEGYTEVSGYVRSVTPLSRSARKS